VGMYFSPANLVDFPRMLVQEPEVIELPKPSDITNVFGLSEPQHMLSKLYFEIMKLLDSMSVWTERREFPEPLFIAFNTAVTAWHIADWLWESRESTRALMKKKFKFDYNEWSLRGRNRGFDRFQKAVVKDCRPLYVCREIANASKHMRRRRSDPKIRALAQWHPAREAAGHVNVGDLVMSLIIFDGDMQHVAEKLFIDAAGYWENLLRAENLITAENRLPDKIIKAKRALR
jgi:hypothetical protein